VDLKTRLSKKGKVTEIYKKWGKRKKKGIKRHKNGGGEGDERKKRNQPESIRGKTRAFVNPTSKIEERGGGRR